MKNKLILSKSKKSKKSYPATTVNGVTKEFYLDGKVDCEYVIKNDNFNGPYKEYYPNGQVKIKGTAVDGEWDGSLKFYDEAGNLKNEMKYDSGKLLEEIK